MDISPKIRILQSLSYCFAQISSIGGIPECSFQCRDQIFPILDPHRQPDRIWPDPLLQQFFRGALTVSSRGRVDDQ